MGGIEARRIGEGDIGEGEFEGTILREGWKDYSFWKSSLKQQTFRFTVQPAVTPLN
jgi:hypothetical protein